MCSISTPQLHCPGQPQTSILSRNSSEMPNLIKKSQTKVSICGGRKQRGQTSSGSYVGGRLVGKILVLQQFFSSTLYSVHTVAGSQTCHCSKPAVTCVCRGRGGGSVSVRWGGGCSGRR